MRITITSKGPNYAPTTCGSLRSLYHKLFPLRLAPVVGVMSQMDSRQLISASILAALEGEEFPSFAELEGEASKEIVSLVKSYDYSASSAFKERVLGKSEEFRQQLLRSVSNPARARELREQFLQSVRDIESSDRIFDYVSPDRARNIVKIRELLASAKSS